MALLDCFSEASPALTLSELARASGLYPSTAMRLLASLERAGMLLRDDVGRYRPGPKLHRLGRLYDPDAERAAAIRPVLASLAQETGETAAFYVREGANRLCLFRVNGQRPVRSHLDEGAVLPLDRGAAGHVLLAYAGGTDARHAEVRRSAFCLSRGERDADSAAVAVPVFGPGRVFSGALGVTGPINRFGDAEVERMLLALRIAAGAISSRLTWGEGPNEDGALSRALTKTGNPPK